MKSIDYQASIPLNMFAFEMGIISKCVTHYDTFELESVIFICKKKETLPYGVSPLWTPLFFCKETTLDTLNEAKVCDSMFGDLFNKRLIKIQPLQF